MQFCPNCGEQLPDGQTFCTRCGTAMPVQQAGGGYFGPTVRKGSQIPPTQAAQGVYPQGNAPAPGNGQGGAGAFPQGGMYPPGNGNGNAFPQTPYPPGNGKQKGGKNPLPLVLIVILALAICGGGGYFAARTFLFSDEDTRKREDPSESAVGDSNGDNGEDAQGSSAEGNGAETGTPAEENGNGGNADEQGGEGGASAPGGLSGMENAPGNGNAPGTGSIETETAAETSAESAAEPETQPRPVTAEVLYANRLDFSHLRQVPIFRERVFESSRIIQRDRAIDNSGYMAFDGNDQTSWQEGLSGDGIGEYVEAGFDREYRVKALTLLLGNHRNSRDWFLLNNRPRQIAVTLGPAIFHAEFPDERTQFALEFSDPVPASSIRITIESVYYGRQYSDTCIADITVYESTE